MTDTFRPTRAQLSILSSMNDGDIGVATGDPDLIELRDGQGQTTHVVATTAIVSLLRVGLVELRVPTPTGPLGYIITDHGRALLAGKPEPLPPVARYTESDAYRTIVEHLPALRDAMEDIAAALISIDSMAQRLMAANDVPVPVGVWGDEEPAVQP